MVITCELVTVFLMIYVPFAAKFTTQTHYALILS